jgi:hypothetical protein
MNKKDLNAVYSRVRSKVEHEDNLVNQRLTWMITLHGLLFTAYGFSLTAQATALSAPGLSETSSDIQKQAYGEFLATFTTLRHAMAGVGIVSSFAALIGVAAAYRAIRDDAAMLDDSLFEKYEGFTYPAVIGRSMVNILGIISGLLIPFLAGGVWTWIGGFISDFKLFIIGAVVGIVIIIMIWAIVSPHKKKRKRLLRAHPGSAHEKNEENSLQGKTKEKGSQIEPNSESNVPGGNIAR